MPLGLDFSKPRRLRVSHAREHLFVVPLGNQEENYVGSAEGHNLRDPSRKVRVLRRLQYELVPLFASKVLAQQGRMASIKCPPELVGV